VQERMKPVPPVALPAASNSNSTEVPILFVRSEGRLIKMDFEKIWFVEGLKDYVRFWTDTGKVIVHSTMKNIEEQLAAKPAFIRISKSYIVNLMFVTEVDGNTVRIKDQSIAIGNTYREEVHLLFNHYKLL
jgi:DNA-binding LytR/AlgR family response regulator